MNFNEMKFDGKDIVKLLGFVLFMGTMWSDLKTEQANAKKEREFLQYQIAELKSNVLYVKPEEPKIKSYTR